MPQPSLGKAIQIGSEVKGRGLWHRKRLQLRPCKLITLIPPCSTYSCTFSSDMIAAFWEEYLFHPKARSGTIEQAEQGEMVVLGSIAGQLDDRSRLLKYLPATVEYEVVVRGDKGKRDGQRGAKTFESYLMPLPPRQSFAEICSLVKSSTIAKDRMTTPEPSIET